VASKAGRGHRQRGFVRRRGNSFEVVVYAGTDPLTGKDRYLSRSTRDQREVDKIRTALLAQVDQQRAPATRATLSHTLDAWLEMHEAEASTPTATGGTSSAPSSQHLVKYPSQR
jgi:integrase